MEERSSEHVLTKEEFMTKFINDKYKKRMKERYNEADSYMINSAIRQRNKTNKTKRKGVLKYEF